MKLVRIIGLLAVTGLFGAGCMSYSTVHTATPVEEGKAQIKGTTGAYSANFSSIAPNQSGGGIAVGGFAPTFEFHGRYGLGNNMDLGGKIYPIGAGIDFNYAIINEADFAFSINPAISGLAAGGGGGAAGVGTGFLNILADVVKTDVISLTVGAKPGGFLLSGGGASFGTPLIGGTAGATVKLGDNFALQPWFDGVYATRGGGSFWWTGLLGFSFGL